MSVCDHIEQRQIELPSTGEPAEVAVNCPQVPTGRLVCVDNVDLIPLDYCDEHGPRQAWLLLQAGHEVRMLRLHPDDKPIIRIDWDRRRVAKALDVMLAMAGNTLTRRQALATLRRNLAHTPAPGEPHVAFAGLRRIPPLDEALLPSDGTGRNAWP